MMDDFEGYRKELSAKFGVLLSYIDKGLPPPWSQKPSSSLSNPKSSSSTTTTNNSDEDATKRSEMRQRSIDLRTSRMHEKHEEKMRIKEAEVEASRQARERARLELENIRKRKAATASAMASSSSNSSNGSGRDDDGVPKRKKAKVSWANKLQTIKLYDMEVENAAVWEADGLVEFDEALSFLDDGMEWN
jgi:hypothetical protein